MVLQQARHYMRFLRSEQGEKLEDIANSEGVSLAAVEKSVKMIRLHRGINTQENLNQAVVGMLVGNLTHANKALQRGFNAQNYIEQKKADGSTKLVPVPDIVAQQKTLEIFGKYLESMQPKAGGVNLKIQQNNANQANATTNVRAGGYEQMLRDVIGKADVQNALPSTTADVIDPEDAEGDEDEE